MKLSDVERDFVRVVGEQYRRYLPNEGRESEAGEIVSHRLAGGTHMVSCNLTGAKVTFRYAQDPNSVRGLLYAMKLARRLAVAAGVSVIPAPIALARRTAFGVGHRNR